MTLNSNKRPSALIFGEALADVFPDQVILGGAPFNVARHMANLGMSCYLVSRVAEDEIGQAILNASKAFGVNTEFLGSGAQAPSGRVRVDLLPQGGHRFEIECPSAWDELQCPPKQALLNHDFNLLVYGTLALRSPHNRQVFQTLVQSVDCIKVCDFNWREGHLDLPTAIEFCKMADWVKVSDEELALMCRHLELNGRTHDEQAHALRLYLGVTRLIVTLGTEGYLCLDGDKALRGPAHRATLYVDSVGAGDSFLAALLAAQMAGLSIEASLDYAARFAAAICGLRGAVPQNLEFYEPFQRQIKTIPIPD